MFLDIFPSIFINIFLTAYIKGVRTNTFYLALMFFIILNICLLYYYVEVNLEDEFFMMLVEL